MRASSITVGLHAILHAQTGRQLHMRGLIYLHPCTRCMQSCLIEH